MMGLSFLATKTTDQKRNLLWRRSSQTNQAQLTDPKTHHAFPFTNKKPEGTRAMSATKRIRFSTRPNQKNGETTASRIELRDRLAWVQLVTWFSAATPRPPLTLISDPKNGIKNKTIPNRKQALTIPNR
jgi:hypothetical protein